MLVAFDVEFIKQFYRGVVRHIRLDSSRAMSASVGAALITAQVRLCRNGAAASYVRGGFHLPPSASECIRSVRRRNNAPRIRRRLGPGHTAQHMSTRRDRHRPTRPDNCAGSCVHGTIRHYRPSRDVELERENLFVVILYVGCRAALTTASRHTGGRKCRPSCSLARVSRTLS